VLGIAYRRRFNRSFWVKPVAWLFYGVFARRRRWVRTAQHRRQAGPLRTGRTGPHAGRGRLVAGEAWRALPARRNEFDDDQRWPLDVQVAGPPPLQAQLEAAAGTQPQAGWQQALACSNAAGRHAGAAGHAGHAGGVLLMLRPARARMKSTRCGCGRPRPAAARRRAAVAGQRADAALPAPRQPDRFRSRCAMPIRRWMPAPRWTDWTCAKAASASGLPVLRLRTVAETRLLR
jgi:hypothetical protein